MKKLLLSLMFIFGLGGLAGAASNPSLVYPVCISSMTTQIIQLSTTSAIQVDTPTLSGRVVMEIQDLDASANLWCSPQQAVGVSTGTVKIGGGREITPQNWWTVNIADNFTRFTSNPVTVSPSHIYCISDSLLTVTTAAVTQCF